MNYFFKLAFRNLFRHKLRTSVSIMAIAVSIIAVVFTRGLIMGMIDSIFSNQIQYKSGHIRIIRQEYEQKERLLSLNYPVDGWKKSNGEEMLAQLQQIPGIEQTVPRIKFGGLVSLENELVKMMGWGVDIEKEKEFTGIEEMLSTGKMPEPSQNEVIMGRGLLKKLNKEVGDKVTILYNTAFSSFKGRTFKITGAIESELKLLQERVFYLPLDTAQDMLYLDQSFTEILLITPGLDQVDSILPEVKNFFAEKNNEKKYSVIPWDQSGGMIYWMQLARKIYNLIYIFLVVLSSFVVINTMIMIVNERTREIGMMSALGLKSRGILKLFLLEGTIMGIIGSFIGAVLGGVITKILATIGIDYTEAFEGVGEEILMKPIIYPSFSYENMLFGFILGVIVTAIACIIPARRAANKEPNDALREM